MQDENNFIGFLYRRYYLCIGVVFYQKIICYDADYKLDQYTYSFIKS